VKEEFDPLTEVTRYVTYQPMIDARRATCAASSTRRS